MQLPEDLQRGIDEILQNTSSHVLRRAQAALTQTYRAGSDSGSIFADEAQRLAYLGTRMPATYAAVHKALSQIQVACETFLDLGAGPGTASWAASEIFPSLKKITLVERSKEAILLGKSLACRSSNPILRDAEWIQRSLTEPLPDAELMVLSYVLNELQNPASLVEACWEKCQILVLIEPGTPKGFALIRSLRQKLIEKGAFIAAPCPHAAACPNHWCHFAARVERSRLHRMLKEGALGHEDEKFAYLVVSKTAFPRGSSRILRHPLKQSGHVRLSLCNQSGNLEERVVTRSQKEFYRQARDAEWGDSWF